MIIKCSKCGVEYSYGKNICHICVSNIITFGSIFTLIEKPRNWNCFDTIHNNEVFFETDKTHDNRFEEHINIEVIKQEIPNYKWNCFESLEPIDEVDKKVNLEYLYE